MPEVEGKVVRKPSQYIKKAPNLCMCKSSGLSLELLFFKKRDLRNRLLIRQIKLYSSIIFSTSNSVIIRHRFSFTISI